MSPFTTRPELAGSFGMVASTHWLASGAGMRMLELGGTAADAAAAAGFVLQVVEPHMCGPAGEVPILVAPADGDVQVIAGQGPAPAAATVDRFRALGLDLVPGTGLLAACVPGAFDAWLRLLAEHGTLPLSEVLAPAIHYAEHGFPMTGVTAATVAGVADMFLTHWPTSAQVWLPGGRPPVAGTRFTLPGLAETYKRILTEAAAAGPERDVQIAAARRAWSQGFVAAAIAEWCASTEVADSSGRRHGGLLTGDDLARFTVPVERPTTVDYRGWTVHKTGPWGQGPVFLQQLRLLDGYALEELDPVGADFIHLVVEAGKLAFADREAWYGDPSFVDVPLDGLLSPGYAATRRALIGAEASLELRPGSPGGRDPVLPPQLREAQPVAPAGTGEPTAGARGDTCHVSVMDRWGNAVAATPSGGWLQSSPVMPALGFPLGTRAQMFWLTEGLPASLAPGKRPRTTLTPTFARHVDGDRLAFGTPGGDQQDQWSLMFFLRAVNYGMNLQEAIDAPAFHSRHAPSSFWPREAYPGLLSIEGRVPEGVRAELIRRGHLLEVHEDWSLGYLSAVRWDDRQQMLRAAANPRGMQGYAVGR